MAFTTSTFVAFATTILALTDAVAAQGNAIVNNNCNFDVYLWHVSVDHADSQPTVIKANGGDYSEQYVTCTTGGVSLKLSNSPTQETYITQYEYTLDPGNVWYDISNVNCKDQNCPFWQGGMNLASNTNCPVVNCAPNDLVCHAVYNLFNDDWASHACTPSSDLTLTLCPGGSGSTSAGSSSSAAAASSSTPSSTSSTPEPTSHYSPVKVNIVQTPSSSSTTTTTTSTTPTPTKPTTTTTTPPPAPSTTLSTSTTSTSKSKTTSKKHSSKHKHSHSHKHSSKTTKVLTTPAPVADIPVFTQWFTETAIETAYSTVVVTARDASHDDFHKKREAFLHRHHRRHQHF